MFGGTYTQSALNLPSYCTLESYLGVAVTLQPTSGTNVLRCGADSHHIVIRGITLNGVNVSADAAKVTDSAHDITLDDVILQNSPGNGLLVSGTAYNVILSNSEIDNCGADALHHGVYCASVSNLTIHHTEIHNSSGHGIHINGSNDSAQNTVYANYIHDNFDFGIGVYYGSAQVYNNIVRNHVLDEIRVAWDAKVVNVWHNTLIGTGGIRVVDLINDNAVLNVSNNAISVSGNGVWLRGIGYNPLATAAFNNNLYQTFIEDGGLNLNYTQSNNVVSVFAPISDDGADAVLPTVGNPAISAGIMVGVTTDYVDVARATPPTIGAYEP